MPYDLLKQNIRSHINISNVELDKICSYFKPSVIKKKDYLLRQGRICRYEGFVVDGCFRIFTLDTKANENTLYFAARDWWLMDNDSFLNQTPSDLSIQALEDSQVLLISRPEKLALY